MKMPRALGRAVVVTALLGTLGGATAGAANAMPSQCAGLIGVMDTASYMAFQSPWGSADWYHWTDIYFRASANYARLCS